MNKTVFITTVRFPPQYSIAHTVKHIVNKLLGYQAIHDRKMSVIVYSCIRSLKRRCIYDCNVNSKLKLQISKVNAVNTVEMK